MTVNEFFPFTMYAAAVVFTKRFSPSNIVAMVVQDRVSGNDPLTNDEYGRRARSRAEEAWDEDEHGPISEFEFAFAAVTRSAFKATVN